MTRRSKLGNLSEDVLVILGVSLSLSFSLYLRASAELEDEFGFIQLSVTIFFPP